MYKMDTVLLNIAHNINIVGEEIISDKLTDRTKAVEKLNSLLLSSKLEIIQISSAASNHQGTQINWNLLYSNSVDSLIKHSIKLNDYKTKGTFQANKNKSEIYSSLLNKILTYSVECSDIKISTNTIFQGIFRIWSERSAREIFGKVIVQIVDISFLSLPYKIGNLKFNEFTELFSKIFKLANQEYCTFSALQCLVKLIDIGLLYFQCNKCFIEYLPKIENFFDKSKKDTRIIEFVIKINYSLLKTLCIDYHNVVSNYYQQNFTSLCGFYKFQMKYDSKETLFQIFQLFINIHYLDIQQGITTILIANNSLSLISKIFRTLFNIINIEIKERIFSKDIPLNYELFEKLSADVIVILYDNKNIDEIPECSTSKIQKKNSPLVEIISMIKDNYAKSKNSVWFSILKNIILIKSNNLEINEFQNIMEFLADYTLNNFNKSKDITDIRIICNILLDREEELKKTQIPELFFEKLWNNFCHIITEKILELDAIAAKLLLWQLLISKEKINIENTILILKNVIKYKGNDIECLMLIKEIIQVYGITFLLRYISIEDFFSFIYSCESEKCFNNTWFNLTAEISTIAVLNSYENEVNEKLNKSTKYCKDNYMINIKYKYLKRFILIDKSMKENCQKYDTKKLTNFLNKQNFEVLLNFFNLTSEESNITDLINTFIKIAEIIYISQLFIEFNILDSLYYDLLVKKLGLFINSIEIQLKNINKNTVTIENIKTILKIISSFMKKILNYSIKNCILTSEFIGNILKFVITVTESNILEKFSINEENSDIDDIALLKIEILAIYAATYFNNEHAFTLLKRHINFVNQKTECSPKISYLLRAIEYITFNGLSVTIEIANWILDNIKIICQKYHTNVEISTNIINCLPQVFKSSISHKNLVEDIFIIVTSFLKKCYKMNYSYEFNQKIIRFLKDISRYCPKMIIEHDEIQEIYLSIPKFLGTSSLLVQFSVVELIRALIDPNWLLENCNITPEFTEFINKLYDKINNNPLLNNTEDTKMDDDSFQNTTAVIMQLYWSFFCFSQNKSKNVFLELAKYCNVHNINRNKFFPVHQFSDFYQCSQSNLFSDMVESILDLWFNEKYALERLPWYLCYETEYNFYKENADTVLLFILKHENITISKEIIAKVSSKINVSTRELISNAFERIYSFLISQNINNNEHYIRMKETVIEHGKTIDKDFRFSEKDIAKSIKCMDKSKLLIYICQYFYDDEKFEEIIGFKLNIEISISQLKFPRFIEIIEKIIHSNNKYYDENTIEIMKLLNYLKFKIYNTILISYKLLYLCKYIVFINFLLSTMNIEDNTSNRDLFFIKDMLHFLISILHDFLNIFSISKAVIQFTYNLLKRILNIQSLKTTIFTIITKLKDVAENAIIAEIKSDLFTLLEDICEQLLEIDNDFLKVIEPIIESDIFNGTNISLKVHNGTNNKDENIKKSILNFINDQKHDSNSIIKLKYNIFKKKTSFIELTQNEEFIQDYCKKIIYILAQKIKQGTEKEAIEASKCLGTIGPIYINKFAFVCDKNEILYQQNYSIKSYMKLIFELIESLLFNYDPKIYPHVFKLCEKISEYKMFKNSGEFILEPFLNTNKLKSNDIFILNRSIDLINILKNFVNTHEGFIKNIMCYIYENLDMAEFGILCSNSLLFSQLTLIPLCKLLLETSREFKNKIIELLEYYFEQANNAINCKQFDKTIYRNSNTIKYFLDLTECIRISDLKLSINLLHVANVATYQQANFLAVLYLEMWTLNQLEESNYTITNEIIRKNVNFQKIASKAYKSIGCMEAIPGFLDPLSSRQEYLDNSNNWLDILIELDVTQSPTSYTIILENLKQNGLLSLANSYCGNEIDYEVCWRLAKWDIECDTKKIDSNHQIEYFINADLEFEKKHFQALKSISERDESNSVRIIDAARKLINSNFRETSIECIQNLYKFLTKFSLLHQIEDFSLLQFPKNGNNLAELVLQNWESEKQIRYGDFYSKEKLFAQKILLLEMSGIRASRKLEDFYKENDPIGNYLLFVIAACKNSSVHQNLTKRYLCKLRERNCSIDLKAKANLEDAINCWESGKKNIALAILEDLIQNKSGNVLLPRIDAYRVYAQYCAETNKEPFDEIYEKYFKKSLKYLDTIPIMIQQGKLKKTISNLNEYCIETRRKMFKTIAELADKEYVQISHHLNSPIFQTTIKLMNKNQQDAKKLQASGSRDRNDAATYALLSNNSNIDKSEIDYYQNNKDLYLCFAIENYLKFCKVDTSIITPAMYRITSMWLSNKSNKKLKELMVKYILDIPSYKFICILTQLTAHLNSKNSDFIEILQKVIVNCALEHPHHTLSHIYSLINTYADEQNSDAKSLSDSRVQAAKQCWLQIKNNTNCTENIEQLERVSLALIEFANIKIDNKNNVNIPHKITNKIAKLKNLNETQCLTEQLPIRPTKDYTQILSIKKWDEKIELVGGVNAPKKMFCLCSDGVCRWQLLKGQDDMRQDAIMQQVLTFVDNLLKENKDNLEQNLTIRTYKVVPLSKRSGILEWCKNTVPLGMYLTGKKKDSGAHKKYRPSDWTANLCRQKMYACLKLDPTTRLKEYLNICKNIHPVLHYFFFDNFLIPGIWFERRLSYMNSVATSSIVGYILGLGDRHLQNILLDYQTAEVVHIDFGIAFEQGKVMPTPETVPFRLTRDMKAPMGVCEVNGVFQKSCEKTLKILQENSQVLITILEVLLYDPLYCWTTNKKVVRSNVDEMETDEQEKNALAHRALIRVQSKLEGRDDIRVGSTSIETQIQKLIAEATNIQNLSRLFSGWEPYL